MVHDVIAGNQKIINLYRIVHHTKCDFTIMVSVKRNILRFK